MSEHDLVPDWFHPHATQLDRIEGVLHTVERQLARILNLQETTLTTLDDIKTDTAALLAKVSEETNAVQAVTTYVTGIKAQLTDVQQHLADAIANEADPDTLQNIHDQLATVVTGMDANTVAENALANVSPPTPAGAGVIPAAPAAGGTSNSAVSVSSVSPASGLPGTQITITGAGFGAGVIHGIKYGDVLDSSGVVITNPTTITATVPSDAPTDQPIDLALVTDGGDVAIGQFTVQSVPGANAAPAANGARPQTDGTGLAVEPGMPAP